MLRHTWPHFFARHGSLTEAQRRAIPPILDGANVLLSAPTASGKTEAIVAPLIERHLVGHPREAGLCLLYICPTRALVRDLYQRLAPALRELRLSFMMKSGDTGPVSVRRPPALLITTPESTDSLLTRAPRLFATLRAVALDEVHLFDEGPRGDHLRCLLRRIERIRGYAAEQAGREPPPLQRVALSATLPDAAAVAARYLGDDARVVEVAGGRELVAELWPIAGLDTLAAALGQRATRKTLLFCNTRHEVEQVAAFLRHHLPYEAEIFVHYSNLDPALRSEVEERFAAATVALCVSSSTLELGVDIGSVDDVALLGPPPTLSSLLQRAGRGARRRSTTPVLCLPRSPLEALRFDALFDLLEAPPPPQPPAPFRPAVLVQQAFSLLKGSPTGGLRLADLQRLAPDELSTDDLRALLGRLVSEGWLRVGRPGEWRSGAKLDELADRHEIYSNISGELLGATVVDAYSGRRIAQVARPRQKGETFLMGGEPLEVAWRDRATFGVRRGRRADAHDERLRFRTAPFAVPFEVAAAMARRLGLAPGTVAQLPDGEEAWLVHGWGDLYGEWLAALLRARYGEEGPHVEPWNELCLRLSAPLPAFPAWEAGAARAALHTILPRAAQYLDLGRFHALLPPTLAERSAAAHCHPARFEALYRAATLVLPSAGLRERLLGVL